jgi:hypothetical protein
MHSIVYKYTFLQKTNSCHIPSIYQDYKGSKYIPGIYQVYTMSKLSRVSRCQDQLVGEEDQQPGPVRRQPPQEQHGGGGGNGDAAAPGRNRCAPSLHYLCLRDIRVCIMSFLVYTKFTQVYSVCTEQTFELFGLHKVYTSLHILQLFYTKLNRVYSPTGLFSGEKDRLGNVQTQCKF